VTVTTRRCPICKAVRPETDLIEVVLEEDDRVHRRCAQCAYVGPESVFTVIDSEARAAKRDAARDRELRPVAKTVYQALREAGPSGSSLADLAATSWSDPQRVLDAIVWLRSKAVQVVAGRSSVADEPTRYALRESLPESWDGLV
jgi:hypothetical protein